MVGASIIKNGKKNEIRCGVCGKLLFVVSEFSKNVVDISQTNAIIVARCTRSSCKVDNKISIADIV